VKFKQLIHGVSGRTYQNLSGVRFGSQASFNPIVGEFRSRSDGGVSDDTGPFRVQNLNDVFLIQGLKVSNFVIGNELSGYGNRLVSSDVLKVGPATPAVPEPATWGMMIVGLGAVGYAMRRRAKVQTTVNFA
jgi:hypothetical protein